MQRVLGNAVREQRGAVEAVHQCERVDDVLQAHHHRARIAQIEGDAGECMEMDGISRRHARQQFRWRQIAIAQPSFALTATRSLSPSRNTSASITWLATADGGSR